ncbi:MULTISPECIES: helix-turn-helix domain-containing protein [unclassified Pandoraea]|uniref:AraC family transcriptional regulator n=1 Tax=unclassified Pandoraea TaxID=2624094 RepID=UPI000349C515|nr:MULTISPECIES: helix-turn-helix transcriptional regulator [unclassified Pandoraea]QBC30657.1 AraC family transcriptional regulator [Pandoraea sp. XY-2]BDD91194.1 AraC family transcriptional regulator [Pandoraea sp. NE5]
MFGKSEDRDDYQRIARPVGGMARDLPDRFFIDYHEHIRGQLIYASTGAIVVTTAKGNWVVPSLRAVWVPPSVRHCMQAVGAIEMRTLYFDADRAPLRSSDCCVVSVSPLLRELIDAVTRMPVDYAPNSRDAAVVDLLFHEIRPLSTEPLHLPMPSDERIARICRWILSNPSEETSVAAWSRVVGASERTIIRLFPEQTGMTFTRWRQQARLLVAVQMLSAQHSVTDIASSLGYDSTSAFSAMFRKALGCTPTEFFKP